MTSKNGVYDEDKDCERECKRVFEEDLAGLFACVRKVVLNCFNVPCSKRRNCTCDISFEMEHRRLRL